MELLLLQAAQPEPVPQVRLLVPWLAMCHYHHLPLDYAGGCHSADACDGLLHRAVHLEPQRVAQQQSGQT